MSTFTGTKAEISQLKAELQFLKDCIQNLKKIKKWTYEEKQMYFEILKKEKSLEVKLNGLVE